MNTCKTCRHPSRREIDRQIAEGGSLRDIAGRWGIPFQSIHRHKQHLGDLVPKAQIEAAVSALEHSTWLVGKLRKIAERCDGVSDRQFLDAAEKLDKSIKTYGILRKEIVTGGDKVNVVLMDLGVRSLDEAKAAISLSRVGRDQTPEEAVHDALEVLALLLPQTPELSHHAVQRLQRIAESSGMLLPAHEETNGNGRHEGE